MIEPSFNFERLCWVEKIDEKYGSKLIDCKNLIQFTSINVEMNEKVLKILLGKHYFWWEKTHENNSPELGDFVQIQLVLCCWAEIRRWPNSRLIEDTTIVSAVQPSLIIFVFRFISIEHSEKREIKLFSSHNRFDPKPQANISLVASEALEPI